jgi:hypothetical protein
MTDFRWSILSSSIPGGIVTMRVPPGVRMLYATFCVSFSEMTSYISVISSDVMVLTAEGSEIVRSMTCVAPSDFRKVVLCSEAVVIMGEKPDSLAN